MTIHSIYILCKNGGLIYQYDHNATKLEVENSFSFPLDIQLIEQNKKVVVAFGQKDGIHAGNTLLAVNGVPVNGTTMEGGKDVIQLLSDEANYPINLKFGKPKLSTNEKIELGNDIITYILSVKQIYDKVVLQLACSIHCLQLPAN